MNIITIMGFTAAALTTSSFIPQAIRTIRTKDTNSISLFMYSLFTAGTLFWFLFGLFSHNYPVTVANFITLIFAAIILGYKIKYG